MDVDIRKNAHDESRSKESVDYVSIPIENADHKDKEPLLNNRGSRLLESSTLNSHQDKRIAVPVRVEPKVYFANERTFLSWIHFSIFLGGISSALVGLGDEKARTSGYIFGVVSILFTIYALYLYQWRAARIRQRDPGPYDDLVGPVMVSGVFLLAMIANMIFSASSSKP